MDGREKTPYELLDWRVTQLELVEKSTRLELHDLRNEANENLRRDYMTTAEMRNRFVTRKELEADAKARREWWPIVLMAIVALPGTINLILTLRGGR